MKIKLNKIKGILGFGDIYCVNLKSEKTETTIDLTTTEATRLKKLLDVELDN
ncbi:hypothetical protein [uncultured Tenacibaculum sp.]|uniref:hypothetical protein n=1 Tax=uncultured Tenacibaculum sp. TaxID=174713 RepID=UPI00262C792D|nr:hypothetical protein [uncultured Tenacibaculum sp.]